MKVKRFYIMPEIWVTVTQSQVFNWIKLINEKGISTDCVSISTKKNTPDNVKLIEKSLKGRFYEIHNFNKLFINDFYFLFVFLRLYFSHVFKYDKIIFQSRVQIGFAYYFLSFLPKVKLIFEGRGASNEERTYSHDTTEYRSLKKRIKNIIFKKEEQFMITKADSIICVSNALKIYYQKRFNIELDKFSVFPGAADSDLFYFNESLRKEVRKSLNFGGDEVVFIYSGRLEMKWEIPDKIFEFFLDLHRKNNNARLMLLTPDVDIANEFINQFNAQNLVSVQSASFSEVNGYLNAADAGLLLREDVIMNNVASPTKFAEYIMAGLPVIVSKSIHDFSALIDSSGYGCSVQYLEKIDDKEYENFEESLQITRQEISEWGEKNLSKKRYINEYVQLLRNV